MGSGLQYCPSNVEGHTLTSSILCKYNYKTSTVKYSTYIAYMKKGILNLR